MMQINNIWLQLPNTKIGSMRNWNQKLFRRVIKFTDEMEERVLIEATKFSHIILAIEVNMLSIGF